SLQYTSDNNIASSSTSVATLSPLTRNKKKSVITPYRFPRNPGNDSAF
ncbi:22427_t:CDS:1, partial [Racocetra persica]